MKIIIICILVVLTTAVPYSVFLAIKAKCGEDRLIFNNFSKGLCEYDIFGANTLPNPECGRDYYKSLVCETTFKECTDKSLITNYTA